MRPGRGAGAGMVTGVPSSLEGAESRGVDLTRAHDCGEAIRTIQQHGKTRWTIAERKAFADANTHDVEADFAAS
ncbi:hypothetical protein GCM10011591_00230 [Nocardia camponoti]|uniref:Uncharacterized protein n=1 Tax=Nocardia camponoti TaxID=1616106 RepID=A0A917Q8M9_9NOCA|nr:hypothetical protein GCM10011591_00230 [Nocardia camponoti]